MNHPPPRLHQPFNAHLKKINQAKKRSMLRKYGIKFLTYRSINDKENKRANRDYSGRSKLRHKHHHAMNSTAKYTEKLTPQEFKFSPVRKISEFLLKQK